MRITLVKKILADGSACKKCAEVAERLEKDGYTQRIDRIAIADARDPESEGMKLAREHQVELAPFFIVETEGKPPRIYTVYFKLVKEILSGDVADSDEEREILDRGGVDFL